jgi:glycosyltransferase involved in cell wall biosynthesis
MYNEGKRLEECLSQFKDYTDDIVIFDTESSDNTNEIAKRFTDKVFLVPYVGYTSSYDCQAWLKAKYDWCFCVCGDERYYDVLDWVRDLSEEIKETMVAFGRREVVDGVEQPFTKVGYHWRLINRHTSWAYELLDPPYSTCNDTLYSDKVFSHIKNSEELQIDVNHRREAEKTLAYKYRLTNLSPFVEHREIYKLNG